MEQKPGQLKRNKAKVVAYVYVYIWILAAAVAVTVVECTILLMRN